MNISRSTLRERGQAVVELALLAPILVLLALTAVDLGRGMAQYVEVVNAANAAAQFGSSNPAQAADSAAVRRVACNDLDHLSCSNIAVSNNTDDGLGKSMGYVRVSVAVPFHLLTPVLGSFVSATVNSTSVMRVSPAGAQ